MSADGGYWVDVEAARAVAREIEAEIGRSHELVARMRGLTTPSFSEAGQPGHAAVVDLREQLTATMQTALDEMQRTAENILAAMRAYEEVDKTGAQRIGR